MLLVEGTRHGFAKPLQMVLDYYNDLLQVCVGWAEPYLSGVLEKHHSYPIWLTIPFIYTHTGNTFLC